MNWPGPHHRSIGSRAVCTSSSVVLPLRQLIQRCCWLVCLPLISLLTIEHLQNSRVFTARAGTSLSLLSILSFSAVAVDRFECTFNGLLHSGRMLAARSLATHHTPANLAGRRTDIGAQFDIMWNYPVFRFVLCSARQNCGQLQHVYMHMVHSILLYFSPFFWMFVWLTLSCDPLQNAPRYSPFSFCVLDADRMQKW